MPRGSMEVSVAQQKESLRAQHQPLTYLHELPLLVAQPALCGQSCADSMHTLEGLTSAPEWACKLRLHVLWGTCRWEPVGPPGGGTRPPPSLSLWAVAKPLDTTLGGRGPWEAAQGLRSGGDATCPIPPRPSPGLEPPLQRAHVC